MSSPRGLRIEPASKTTTTTTITTTTFSKTPSAANNNNNSNNDRNTNDLPVCAASPSPSLAPQDRPSLPRIREPTRSSSPTKPPSSPPARAVADDGDISEAETLVLHADDVRGKEAPLENGGSRRDWGSARGKEKEGGAGRGGRLKLEGEGTTRKRRKRSTSRADYSSDLSSSRSSVSPARRIRDRGRETQTESVSNPNLPTPQSRASNARKRKAPNDGAMSSDDEHLDPVPEPRPRRRNSLLELSSPQTRKQPARPSSPPHPRLSPSRLPRPRTTPSGLKKQRKIPPPLNTTREDPSDDDSSSSLSRHGSPARRHRRINSAATRTPGSPINMSHKPKRDTAGRTHLHRACGRGAVQEVKQILEQGVELINAEDNAGYMPIHEAALNGHLEVVKALVSYGAQYDIQSRIDLESPLLDAVENGHVPVVEYLLGLGADPRKRDKQGRSCLDANKEGDDESVQVREEIEILLRAAIKHRPAQRTSDDENNRDSVPIDRESPSSRDHSVASPAHQSPPTAVQKNRRRNARAEQSRKDLLWLDSGKGSAVKLREKAREGDLQMVHALLETGLKPDTEALVGAIKGGHTDIVSLLLAYNAEVDPVPGQGDKEGSRKKREVSMPIGEETPMLAAIGRGNVTILRYLLDNGVDPRRKDTRGRSYPEIAREREGEYWQEEVELLSEALRKANSTVGETKSPSRRKSSPKSKSSTKQLRRNSSVTRPQSRPPAKKLADDKPAKRSASANSPHRLSDLPPVSDRESTTEPLGPPKLRVGRTKRSESESLAPGIAKKRRRLVSGKVRDEEAARFGGDSLSAFPERDFDLPSKRSEKPNKVKTEMEDPPKLDTISKKPKLEPLDDVKMEDAPPLPRPKSKIKDRQPSSTRSEGGVRDGKASISRTRSPAKSTKSDVDRRHDQDPLKRRKREELDDRDRYPRRRDSVTDEPRRLREGKHADRPRPTSVSSETSKRRDDPRKSTREDGEKLRPKRDDDEKQRSSRDDEKPRVLDEERRRRIRDRDREKDRDDRERKVKRSKEDKEKPEKPVKEKKIKDKDAPHADPSLTEQKEQVVRESQRTKHLTKELRLIQDDAAKESAKHRELELKRMQEEEDKQRALKEQEEREKKEKEERERAEREERDRVAKEREEQELAAKAKEEQERLEKEAREKEAREKESREREERERKAEEERLAKEAKEREEREAREREEEKQKEAERKLEEERIRKEQERLAVEEQKRQEEAQRKQLEEEAERVRKAVEEEARREKERAEKEARDQLARDQEARRIQSLPFTLRIAAEKAASGHALEDCRLFVPLFAATFSTAPPPLGSTPNGIISNEKWVLNIQAALALGMSDLTFESYPQVEHRPVTEHERLRMWSVLSPLLCEGPASDTGNLEETAARQQEEKEKYHNLQHLFWIRFDDVQNIVASDPRHETFRNLPISTVDVTMNIPTSAPDSPAPLRRSREEIADRIKRRFSKQALRTSPAPNVSGPSTNSMQPPPPFGISNSSG